MTRSPATIAAALLLPPLGVFWMRGAGSQFVQSCVLTMLGFLPGVAHALITAFKPEPRPAMS